MPYTTPSANDLQARYPAFAAVADATVDVWITDALRFVDETWIEDDYQPAILALAAHNMALLSLGTTTGTEAIPAGVTRFKSGSMEIAVSESAASAQAGGGYAATPYGREYQRLLRRNFSGPIAIVAGTLPACP